MAIRLDKPLIMLPGVAKKESLLGNEPERRVTPRFPFTATAEVSELRSQTRIMGRSSDLGFGGCYIDSISPFSAGTVVRLRLERESRKFEAMARITYAHTSMGMGMGMAFTEIKPQFLPVLQTWVSELSGEPSPALGTAIEDPEAGMPGIANTGPVLNELINLLVRKKMISEVEGATLLRQMFH